MKIGEHCQNYRKSLFTDQSNLTNQIKIFWANIIKYEPELNIKQYSSDNIKIVYDYGEEYQRINKKSTKTIDMVKIPEIVSLLQAHNKTIYNILIKKFKLYLINYPLQC